MVAFTSQTYSREIDIKTLSRELEKSFNSRNTSGWETLMSTDIAITLKQEYQDFLKRFPNAEWTIKPGKKLKDNRESLNLSIRSEKKLNNQTYLLEAKQKLAFTKEGNRIIRKEILSEYSILRALKSPLQISLNIPDIVLTGTNYDIDIILEKPLKDGIIAGGLIAIEPGRITNEEFPQMPLMPTESGGLFKSAQSPLNPGIQQWAALIAHPDGLIAITKRVKIVSNPDELIP